MDKKAKKRLAVIRKKQKDLQHKIMCVSVQYYQRKPRYILN